MFFAFHLGFAGVALMHSSRADEGFLTLEKLIEMNNLFFSITRFNSIQENLNNYRAF